MTTANILSWLKNNLYLTVIILSVLSYLIYRGTQFLLARSIYFATIRSKNVYDNLIADRLQPFKSDLPQHLIPLSMLVQIAGEPVFGDMFCQELKRSKQART